MSSPVASSFSNLNPFRHGGRNILADEIRFDRQLAMAAIDQHRQLNRFGRPKSFNASIAARWCVH